MAAKITLGNRPKNFKQTVTFPMLEGGEGSIDVVFKYRTKKEFGQFIDEAKESAGIRLASRSDVPDENGKGGEISWASVHELGIEANADHLIGIIDGWNLESEPTRESFQQLADELPAAANAIFETYRKAIVEGRLGN